MRRPHADRLRARELRQAGHSIPGIAQELGIARSTAYEWTKHIALVQDTVEAARRKAHSRAMTDARWARHRRLRDSQRAELASAAQAAVGTLTDRDLLLLGAAIYWCEGTKSKPWRTAETIQFVNSDVRLVKLFLRFLAVAGHALGEMSFRLAIHETADHEAAQRWWAEQIGVPVADFRKPSLKRHVPRRTNRHNRAEDYHGCLVIVVRRSRETYWRIEALLGAICGPEDVGESAAR
jgi:transposase